VFKRHYSTHIDGVTIVLNGIGRFNLSQRERERESICSYIHLIQWPMDVYTWPISLDTDGPHQGDLKSAISHKSSARHFSTASVTARVTWPAIYFRRTCAHASSPSATEGTIYTAGLYTLEMGRHSI